MMDKRDRAEVFRLRLAEALLRDGQSQSGLARAAGVDRSTISALLAPGTRLPNAQLAADCAQALRVSTDWLLGLTDHPDPPDRLLADAVQMIPATRALFDATIYGWHRDAAGYKIRHVPATMPDMLKTPAVVEWEYREALGPKAAQAIQSFETQLAWLRGARSDYEIAVPMHEVASFAAATGYWSGLSAEVRAAQIDTLIRLCDELYPVLRLYLFDAHRVFSAPVTVFGPHLAVIYLGRHYLVFRDPAKIAAVSQHFDWLVKEAPLGARDAAVYLRDLRGQIT
ncbi:MAG: helix-turn-helix transcriptional regulator [Paracoccaceae bacterium]